MKVLLSRHADPQHALRIFLMLAGFSVLGAGLLLYLVHFGITGRLRLAINDNAYLVERTAALDGPLQTLALLKAERAEVLLRMAAIKTLEANRADILLLFDSFVKALPQGVFFTLVKRKDKMILMEGKTVSQAAILTLMRHLEATPLLQKPDLKTMKVDDADLKGFKKFSLMLH